MARPDRPGGENDGERRGGGGPGGPGGGPGGPGGGPGGPGGGGGNPPPAGGPPGNPPPGAPGMGAAMSKDDWNRNRPGQGAGPLANEIFRGMHGDAMANQSAYGGLSRPFRSVEEAEKAKTNMDNARAAGKAPRIYG